MATITLSIQQAPAVSGASMHALRYAQAAIAQQHAIKQVFFYQAGVLHADSRATLPTDEPDMTQAWINFSAEHQVPLVVCHTVGERMGISESMHPQFSSAGLTEFLVALAESDKVVQFR